jgi:AdoMet-dependent rRNA methyltransferase SPB1
MAINARVPKKILEAKVRRKIRVQRKLKKTQKQAENVMSQEGVTEYNKLRQVGKMYDKAKQNLKDTKKYVVATKSKTTSGKDSRGVKHVDKRMKKDKRSLKVKKNRHVHRKNKKRGKF